MWLQDKVTCSTARKAAVSAQTPLAPTAVETNKTVAVSAVFFALSPEGRLVFYFSRWKAASLRFGFPLSFRCFPYPPPFPCRLSSPIKLLFRRSGQGRLFPLLPLLSLFKGESLRFEKKGVQRLELPEIPNQPDPQLRAVQQVKALRPAVVGDGDILLIQPLPRRPLDIRKLASLIRFPLQREIAVLPHGPAGGVKIRVSPQNQTPHRIHIPRAGPVIAAAPAQLAGRKLKIKSRRPFIELFFPQKNAPDHISKG